MQKTKRPWQGQILIILVGIIGTLTALIAFVMIFEINFLVDITLGRESAQSFLGALETLLEAIIIITLIVQAYILHGLIKGKKAPLYLLLILQLLTIPSLGNAAPPIVILTPIMIYLEIACIRHPFYKK